MSQRNVLFCDQNSHQDLVNGNDNKKKRMFPSIIFNPVVRITQVLQYTYLVAAERE